MMRYVNHDLCTERRFKLSEGHAARSLLPNISLLQQLHRPLSTARLFLPPASGSHTPDARYAQELDRRWRPRLQSHISRMIAVGSRRGWLTERLRFLSLARGRSRVLLSTVQVSGVRFPRAPLCLSVHARLLPPPSTPKPKLPIRRSAVISSPPIFPLPGLAVAYTPARIPINKKNTPGRPQNGSSFTRSPSSWHLVSDLGISRSSTPYHRSFAAYNKLATRARIMPSYWK